MAWRHITPRRRFAPQMFNLWQIMLQIVTAQRDQMTIALHQTAVLHVDRDGKLLSISEDAVQLLASCPDAVEVTTQGQFEIIGNDALADDLAKACGDTDGGVQRFETYSALADTQLTLHVLPRPETGACIVVFASGLGPSHQSHNLTQREWDVLFLAAKGMRRDRMAHALGISVATVDLHCANLRRKTGARTTAEAVAKALTKKTI